MRLARTVTAPNGERWRVGRHWMARPLRGRWQMRRPGREQVREGGSGVLDNLLWFDLPPIDGGDLDEIAAVIAIAVAGLVVVALIAFVLLPLLGIALELAVVIAVSTSGVFGSVVLRRPWTIAAVRIDGTGGEPATFAVKGWRRSGQAIRAVARAIEQTGRPPQPADTVLVPSD